jgi:hemerythrin
MTLIWRKQLEIGDETIDIDHKYLICMINTVELTIRTPEHRDLLPATLEQLVDYTHAHFKREESMMLAMSYPRYVQHKQQHQLLIQELGNIEQKIQAKGDGDFSDEECADLAKLFRHWLLDHLVKEDMLLRPYLTGK